MKSRGTDIMTINELAAEVRVHRVTIGRWLKKGVEIPHFPVGKRVRFRREDVEKWIQERMQEAQQ